MRWRVLLHELVVAWIAVAVRVLKQSSPMSSGYRLQAFAVQHVAPSLLAVNGRFLGHHVQLRQRTVAEHTPEVDLSQMFGNCQHVRAAGRSHTVVVGVKRIKQLGRLIRPTGPDVRQSPCLCRCSRANVRRSARFSVGFSVLFSFNGRMTRLLLGSGEPSLYRHPCVLPKAGF